MVFNLNFDKQIFILDNLVFNEKVSVKKKKSDT